MSDVLHLAGAEQLQEPRQGGDQARVRRSCGAHQLRRLAVRRTDPGRPLLSARASSARHVLDNRGHGGAEENPRRRVQLWRPVPVRRRGRVRAREGSAREEANGLPQQLAPRAEESRATLLRRRRAVGLLTEEGRQTRGMLRQGRTRCGHLPPRAVQSGPQGHHPTAP